MRSRRGAVDNGGDTWIYDVDFNQQTSSDSTPTANHGSLDYITLNTSGTGDDPAYADAALLAPSILTVWSAGLISYEEVTPLQQIFMGLDTANLNYNAFPGAHDDLGHLDPATVSTINVGAQYQIQGKYPVAFFRVLFEDSFATQLAQYTSTTNIILGGTTTFPQVGGNPRPADAFVTNLTDNPDSFTASAQSQTVHGLGGDDTLTTGTAQTDLYGDGGSDVLTDTFGKANLYGGDGNDVISVGPSDYVDAGAGDDTVYGVTQSAADLAANGYTGIRGYFDGGAGTDKAVFDFGASTKAVTFTLVDDYDPHVGNIITSGGTLALVGFESTEIDGGSGNDILTAAAGNDLLIGRNGNDVLDGGQGADAMIGGAGDDTYYIDNPGDRAIELKNEGYDTIYSSVTYAISGPLYPTGTFIEALVLTGTAAINATGNSQANTITGNSAANIINGGGGADTMIGGAGDDTYFVDNVGDKVIELKNEGYDTVKSSVTYALSGAMYPTGTFVEALVLTGTAAINGTGNGLDNALTGNDAANTLNGGGGADTMSGRKGDDTYIVDNVLDKVIEANGQGYDTVFSSVTYALSGAMYPTGTFVEALTLTGSAAINATGNGLNNALTGNGAANVLDGLTGNDTLTGGAGADTFRFSVASGAANADKITDFVSGTDHIALAAAVFTGLAAGALNPTAFHAGTAAACAADHVIYDSVSGQLWFDPDGTGSTAQSLIATLTPGATLVAGDILVF